MVAQIVFATNTELPFVAGLARWISPPAEPAPAAAVPESGAGDAGAAPAAAPAVVPSAYELECVAMEGKGEYAQLAARLRDALKGRFASAPEVEVEVAYTVLLQLLLKWELLDGSLLELADELASSREEARLRRTLLLSLYGVVNQHGLVQLRFPLLTKLLSYCAAVGALDQLLGGAAKRVVTVERWMESWELSDAQKKELWGLIFDAYADDADATYENAMKYLKLYDPNELSSDKALRGRLVNAILASLRSPTLLTCDRLAQLPIVGALASDAEYAPLSRLLQIFAREMYGAYLEAHAEPATQTFMAAHGLEHAACERKMRLLSLTSLCAADKELTYEAVAEALKVEPSHVEAWVVEAINAGLIVAKMDQVHSKVAVTSCLEREFGKEQFGRLQSSLDHWASSVQHLLKAVVDHKSAP